MSDAVSTTTPFDGLTVPSKLALVTSPGLPSGISGFLLDIVEDEAVELTSDITDHYTEKNFAIQDHIALRPEVITLRGSVGETVVLKKTAASAAASTRDALPLVDDFLPEITEGAIQSFEASSVPPEAINTPFNTYSSSVRAPSLTPPSRGSGYLQATPTATRQKDAFGYLYALWKGRQFVSIETPWGTFPTTLIQSLRAEQPEDSRFKSEFTVVFKVIRFASDIVVKPKADGRADAQSADSTPIGTAGQQLQPYDPNIVLSRTHPPRERDMMNQF